MSSEDFRNIVQGWMSGAASLQLAFVGVSNGLFDAFASPRAPAEAAAVAGVDAGYVLRWAEAAYAFGLLESEGETFTTSTIGRAFRPGAQGTLMPAAVQAILGAHMMERTASLMKTGERPGEVVLGERPAIAPWFGPMLEASFGGFFADAILPRLDVFDSIDRRGGLVVDLGCGNGWYLRALAHRFQRIRGLGLDGMAENIAQAETRTGEFGGRLQFRKDDIFTFSSNDPVDAVVMNRALHHVWNDAPRVFATIRDVLVPGGAAIIWEPAWPATREALRHPRLRPMAFQNLSEHVQGNHFLSPDAIVAAFAAVGMTAETFLFAEGAEAVVVARRDA
jgi:SAM-dependent methyltransferase